MIFNMNSGSEKSEGSLSLSASSGTIRYVSDTKTFTVTRAGDGAISVKSSNTKVATATLSGNTVTVKPTGTGTATITVSVAEGTNHKAPASKTYTVTTQGYLIYNGVPCYTVVGIGKQPQSGFPAAESVVVRQYDGYYYVATSDYNYGMAYLNTKVDLTNYTKMTIQGTFTQDADSWNHLSAWTSIGNYVVSGRVATVVLGATSASVDVSSVDRTAYVGLSLKDKAQKITSLRLT